MVASRQLDSCSVRAPRPLLGRLLVINYDLADRRIAKGSFLVQLVSTPCGAPQMMMTRLFRFQCLQRSPQRGHANSITVDRNLAGLGELERKHNDLLSRRFALISI